MRGGASGNENRGVEALRQVEEKEEVPALHVALAAHVPLNMSIDQGQPLLCGYRLIHNGSSALTIQANLHLHTII